MIVYYTTGFRKKQAKFVFSTITTKQSSFFCIYYTNAYLNSKPPQQREKAAKPTKKEKRIDTAPWF
jgi:hypothetical protein